MGQPGPDDRISSNVPGNIRACDRPISAGAVVLWADFAPAF